MQKRQLVQLGLMGCVAGALISCATMQNYSKAVNTWHGAPERALLGEWGHPTEVKRLSNGHHVDVYHVAERNRSHRVYWDAVPFVRTSPQTSKALVMSHTPNVMHNRDDVFWCDTSFEVNKMGMIVNVTYTGNNCVATQDGVKRWAY